MGISDRAFIAGGLRYQLVKGEPLVLMTATEGEPARPFAEASKGLSRLLHQLGDWRAAEGLSRGFPYVVIPEPHRGGVVHWHALLAGFVYREPSKSQDGRCWPGHGNRRDGLRISKRRLKAAYGLQGFGTGFIGLRAVAADYGHPDTLCEAADGGVEAVARYLSKYLTKAGPVLALEAPKGYPLLRHSQSVNAWWPGFDLTTLRHGAQAPERESGRATRLGYQMLAWGSGGEWTEGHDQAGNGAA